MMERPRLANLLLILSIGLLSISFGSIFVKWANEAPSITIAFFRMFWAAVVLSPCYLSRRLLETTSPGPDRGVGSLLGWRLLSGLALALHFAFWIGSLRYTSVAVSVLLVNTSPILVSLLSFFLFRERLTWQGGLGMALAFLGAVLLFWHDLDQMGSWRGSGLALAGAAMFGLYLVAGRTIRRSATLLEYVYPTYLLAALILGAMAWTAGATMAGFSGRTYLFLFLLGLIPQCLGHTSYNWALKYLPATVVSVLALAEPVLAPVLAYLTLGETLGRVVLIGGGCVAAGILLVSRWGVRGEGRSKK